MPLDNNGAHLDGDFRGDIAPTIVGIFSAPKEPFRKSTHSLSGNTVILPAKSVPIASKAAPLPASLEDLFSYPVQWDEDGNLIHNENEPFENIGAYPLLTFMPSVPIPDLFTAIIQPGKLEAFKAAAAAAGLSEDFLYSDQGFSALEGPIARLRETADTLLVLSLAVWGVFLVVLLILALRERHELGLLLSVGVRRENAAWRLVFGWLAVLVPALLAGGILASAGFGGFSRAVLGNLLTESEFSTRFSVGMTANPAATTAAEFFAAQTTGQTPLAEIWLAALLQLMAYFAILWVLFTLLARIKPQTLLR